MMSTIAEKIHDARNAGTPYPCVMGGTDMIILEKCGRRCHCAFCKKTMVQHQLRINHALSLFHLNCFKLYCEKRIEAFTKLSGELSSTYNNELVKEKEDMIIEAI